MVDSIGSLQYLLPHFKMHKLIRKGMVDSTYQFVFFIFIFLYLQKCPSHFEADERLAIETAENLGVYILVG